MRYSVPKAVGLSRSENSDFNFEGPALALYFGFAPCAGHEVRALKINFGSATAVFITHCVCGAADDGDAVCWCGVARVRRRLRLCLATNRSGERNC